MPDLAEIEGRPGMEMSQRGSHRKIESASQWTTAARTGKDFGPIKLILNIIRCIKRATFSPFQQLRQMAFSSGSLSSTAYPDQPHTVSILIPSDLY